MDIKTVAKGMLVAALVGSTPLVFAEGENLITWSSGVGIDNREVAPTTGTKLVLLTEQGQFLADVHVTVKDNEDRVVVDTVTEGPWLIMNLPHGTYNVLAKFEDRAQIARIVVDQDSQDFPLFMGITGDGRVSSR